MDVPGRRALMGTFVMLQVIFLSGVTGYMIIEGYSFIDAFYMTSITLSTVGFSEIRPLTMPGRIFTIILITFGVLSIGAFVAAISRTIIEGQLEKLLGRRKMKKEIERIKGHFIVAGYGRMGRIICQELKGKGVPYVVIERNQEVFGSIGEEILAIQGNATSDAILDEAGIKRARGLVSVVSSDADNVYIVLTARGLAQDIYIVARAGEEGSEQKLIRAGADKVVSPYVIGGSRMANAILRPTVVDFIELVTMSEHLDLQMEEVRIKKGSPIANVTLQDSAVRRNLNIIVVAIKKEAGHMVFNPSSTTILEPGDCLIILGDAGSLAKLADISGSG